MANPVITLLRLTGSRKRLLLASGYSLIRAAFRVKRIPPSVLVLDFGTQGKQSGLDLSIGHLAYVRDVEWAIAAISRRMRVPPTCLMQAAAAKELLSRRGIPATVYFGVAPACGDGRAINAHAWLRCGKRIITGREEAQRFKPIAWFA
jgi:hypothetical protein